VASAELTPDWPGASSPFATSLRPSVIFR
jgi:hypothetical protein